MEPSWEMRATYLVTQTLDALLLTLRLCTDKHLTERQKLRFDLAGYILNSFWIYSVLIHIGFARRYRGPLAVYNVVVRYYFLDWQPLRDAVVAAWPAIVKLGAAGAIILASWQHFPRLRARVLL